MSSPSADRAVATRVLDHLLGRLDRTPAVDEPFSHIYLENVVPDDLYARLLANLPDPALYDKAAERHYGNEEGSYVRSMFALSTTNLGKLSGGSRVILTAVAAALTALELKRAVFGRLAKDLAFRYGVSEDAAPDLPGFSRPTLYRETEGFEIPPHPDTRKKVVTMHLYLPADRSQLDLGTALYRRRSLALPFGDWRRRFVKDKQFAFQPNSGYAFVVNNTLTKRSWHGRERLPDGAGVRNTLLTTYYEQPREGFGDYYGAERETVRRAA